MAGKIQYSPCIMYTSSYTITQMGCSNANGAVAARTKASTNIRTLPHNEIVAGSTPSAGETEIR